jgi:hypothetical protein
MTTKFTDVYHVSPVSHIHKLRPTGYHQGIQVVPQRQGGVYVAPTYADAIEWFVSYVAHNKHLKHDQHRSPRLREQGRGSQKDSTRYKYATIYKIKIPTSVLQQSWHNNNWEQEYFITQLDQLEIVWSRTYTFYQLARLSRQRNTNRYEINRYQSPYDTIAKQAPHNPAATTYTQLKNHYAQTRLHGEPRDKHTEELLLKLIPYFCDNPYWRPHAIPQLTPAKKQELQPLIQKIHQIIKPR